MGAEEVQSLPVMAVDLDRVAEVAGPAGLVVERVESAEDVRAFVAAYAPAMGVPDTAVAATAEREAGRSARHDELVRFVGRLDGRIVGTAAASISNGVTGVYVVTTDPAHRRRGIGTALTAAALGAGRERGLRVGTLQASPDGEPVYRRMGFTTVSRYRLFALPPAERL